MQHVRVPLYDSSRPKEVNNYIFDYYFQNIENDDVDTSLFYPIKDKIIKMTKTMASNVIPEDKKHVYLDKYLKYFIDIGDLQTDDHYSMRLDREEDGLSDLDYSEHFEDGEFFDLIDTLSSKDGEKVLRLYFDHLVSDDMADFVMSMLNLDGLSLSTNKLNFEKVIELINKFISLSAANKISIHSIVGCKIGDLIKYAKSNREVLRLLIHETNIGQIIFPIAIYEKITKNYTGRAVEYIENSGMSDAFNLNLDVLKSSSGFLSWKS